MPFLNRICVLGFVFLFLPRTTYSQINLAAEKQLLFNYEKEKNETRKFIKLLRLAEFYKINNIQKADSIKFVLIQKSHNFSDSLRFAALYFNVEMNQMNGYREDYFNVVLACQPFLNDVKSEDVQFNIYRHLGNYHSLQNEFETADFYLNYALKLARKKKSKHDIAIAYMALGKNFMVRNDKDSALSTINLAIQNARRASDKSVLAESFNCQAEVYSHFDQVELSVAKNILALQLAMEISDNYKIAKYSREIGETQLNIKNLDDADFYFQQAYVFALKINDLRQRGLVLSDIGSVLFEKKQLTKAIKNNEMAIKLLSKMNDPFGLGNAHNNLGMIYREQQKFDAASTNFNQALIYFESIGDKERIATVFHNVGTVFLAQKKYSNALKYLSKSIEIRKEFGSENQIYHTYRVIADLYRDLGQNEKSLDYLMRYINYIDSNSSLQSATKIAELSELYRAEQRDRLITTQSNAIAKQRQEKTIASAKLENSKLRNSFQAYVIGGFVLLVLFAGIILNSNWRQSKLIQQQKETEMSQTLLRAQMNPHFVFNAMSVIQSYIYENDTVNSSKFLVNFSRLMRLILENSPKEEISINTEEEILNKYLGMQKLRFEDRFEYDIEISNELKSEGAMIPPMITQPFIENSIEHGQLHTIEGGMIKVSFTKEQNMLSIRIEDNGIGRNASAANKKSKAHKSMALKITNERIANLNKKYRADGFLLIEDFDKTLNTGTKVLISLPYRTDISNKFNS